MLIAECPAQRLNARKLPQEGPARGTTERDLDGSVRWQYTRLKYPTTCLRLPNGNTFVGERNGAVAEITAEAAEVYVRKLAPEDPFVSYQWPFRLPDGRVLCARCDSQSIHAFVETDPHSGIVLKVTPLEDKSTRPARFQPLPKGHYRIGGNREVDEAGKTTWELPESIQGIFLARLAGGTLWTMHSQGRRLAEFDPSGRMLGEVLVSRPLSSARLCLSLVRFGFDPPHAGDFDLRQSVSYRVNGLRSEEPFVRRTSARELMRLGPKAEQAIPELIESLADPEEQVRQAAADALYVISSGTVPALTRALKDSRPTVRLHALTLLYRLQSASPETVLPYLHDALKDPANLVRRRSASLLAVIGKPSRIAVPDLIKALSEQDTADDPRAETLPRAAAYALGEIGPEARAAVPALIKALESSDIDLRLAAAVALGKIGPSAAQAVPRLLETLEAKDVQGPDRIRFIKRCTLWALGSIGADDERTVPALVQALLDERLLPDVRAIAAGALGGIGQRARAAIPTLTALKDDPSPELRTASRKALSKIDP